MTSKQTTRPESAKRWVVVIDGGPRMKIFRTESEAQAFVSEKGGRIVKAGI